MSEPLHVAINARLAADGTSGGIFQFTQSLITSLIGLTDGEEHYTVVMHASGADWLDKYRSDRVRSVRAASVQAVPGESGSFYDSLGADIVHFPYQAFFKCRLPTVFNPHDLQHLHLPHFFSPEELARREKIFPSGCRDATAVAVAGGATKADVVTQFGVDPARVFVIPVAMPTERSIAKADAATLQRVRQQYKLPPRFALYPAQTWKHKNHLGLLDAVALLRDHTGEKIFIVCTGKQNDFCMVIRERIAELKLSDHRAIPRVSSTGRFECDL